MPILRVGYSLGIFLEIRINHEENMSILNDPVIKILREKNDLLFEMRGYSNVISFAIDERSNLEKKVKELDEKQAKLENKPDLKIAK